MAFLADDINSFLQDNKSALQISFFDEDSNNWRFKVQNHSVWPGVDACEKITSIKLEENIYVHASAAPWKCGYHGTSVPNMLKILAEGGFNNKHSGDTPAGTCLAPKFSATDSYNFGAVLQCDVHGFQHPLHARIMKAYVQWTGECIPIGMNSKNKKKGTPVGQLTSHPKNLCIKYIYIDKNTPCQYLLLQRIQPTAGACYAGESDPFASLQKILAKRATISSEEDFRVLALAARLNNKTITASSSFDSSPTATESSLKTEVLQNPDASDDIKTLKQRPSSSTPPPLKFKRLKPPVVNMEKM